MEYNKKQKDAINSDFSKTVVLAPAGSGKTTVLIGAIKRYKEEYPDSKIVAITFTKKAAEDIQNRLSGLKGIKSSTIHSWAYQELDYLSYQLEKENPNSGFKIKLLQEDKIKEILKEISKKRRYYYIKENELYFYIMGNYNIDIEDWVKKMYEAIRNDYIIFKKTHGLYDFTDLPEYLLDKLNDYNRAIQHIDAFFVDEFQDVDPIQIELFDKVITNKKFFIGDVNQSIYQFRGATPNIIRELKDFNFMELDVNYRSYQEIIDFATTAQKLAKEEGILFSSIMESYQSEIKCVRGKGGKAYTLNRANAAYEINQFKKLRSQDLIKEFIDRNSIVLCRKNKEVRQIKNLGYSNVTTIHQAKGLEFPSVILTDFETSTDEDINIAYVGMTRAENHLLATNYAAFIKNLIHLKDSNQILKPLF